MTRATPLLIAAGAACAAATLLFGATLQRALDVTEPAPPAVAGAGADDGTVAAADTPARLSNDALLLAVDNDPFQPDRKRSPFRYRLPGDEPPPPPPAPPPPPPLPPFRLIGTGSTARGGVAVIEIENTARLVEVGESLLGYTLTDVSAEHATMSDREQTVRLPLLASVAAAEPTRANQRPNQRGQQPPANARFQFEGGVTFPQGQPRPGANPDEIRELMERVREMGGNMTPQMMQAIQRLQAEGRAVEVQTQNGRMMIRTRPDTTDTQAPRAPNIF